MRDDLERIRDMLEACAKVDRFVAQGEERFQTEELVQIWVIHHLMIVGEAAGRLTEEFRRKHASIPWPQIVAMRNLLIHEYFGIDLPEVWRTASVDAAALTRKLEAILSDSTPS